MSEDRCVICGAYVPEGRMICPNCEAWKKAVSEDNWKRALEYCDNDVLAMKNLSHGEMVQIAEGKRKPMPRYIDADAVLQARWNNLYQLEDEMEKKHGLDSIERLNVQNGFEAALKAVVAFPSSDVVEVVRCKDCKWSNDDCSECMNPTLALGGDYTSCLYIEPNWFCADGRRKEKNDAKIR